MPSIPKNTKFIFITGGVVSGLGKGITAASLGLLLKARGLKVTNQKLDPYLNIDPGIMNPYQHGEVFVTEDGCEADLDLGHYERFIDEDLNKHSSVTSGKIYWEVLTKERTGGYKGETVQVIPHITTAIKEKIYAAAKKSNNADISIIEIGGTAGDIEALPFIEAARQIVSEVGRDNCLFIHVTLALHLKYTDELKTKPTQHSVKNLQSLGISPNIIIVRTNQKLSDNFKQKISLFCGVPLDCVIENSNVPLLYSAPIMLENSNFSTIVSRELSLPHSPLDLSDWNNMLDKAAKRQGSVKIGLVGKYTKMYDTYLSVTEALTHAGIHNGTNIDIKWIDSESLTDANIDEILGDCAAVIVPGGFGDRGIDGMILAAEYCRKKDLPYFGICLGMQILLIEFAKNVAKLSGAASGEFDKDSPQKVIDLIDWQLGADKAEANMRLGAHECKIEKGSLLHSVYKKESILERHRHKYGFNNDFRDQLAGFGLKFSGLSTDGRLVEAAELPKNRFHLGVQFHPEFKSRPHKPHPLFLKFVAAALNKQ
ncbi:MAG: CTP synthase [Firmicutes bacterium]|nr:CTP synthase [Bacillota bacterium]